MSEKVDLSDIEELEINYIELDPVSKYVSLSFLI